MASTHNRNRLRPQTIPANFGDSPDRYDPPVFCDREFSPISPIRLISTITWTRSPSAARDRHKAFFDIVLSSIYETESMTMSFEALSSGGIAANHYDSNLCARFTKRIPGFPIRIEDPVRTLDSRQRTGSVSDTSRIMRNALPFKNVRPIYETDSGNSRSRCHLSSEPALHGNEPEA